MFAGKGPIDKRLGQVFKGAIDLYTAPPYPRGCMIVGTAAVEAPTRPKIAAAAAELLQATEDAFERAFAKAVTAGSLAADPSPEALARNSPARPCIRWQSARGSAPSLPKCASYAASLIPVILPLVLLRWRRVSPD